jgi:HK97 family phage portal protein
MRSLQQIYRQLGFALLKRGNFNPLVYQEYEYDHGRDNPDPTGKALKINSRSAWVYTCVWAISSFGAMVPARAYQIPKGKTEDEKEHLPYDHALQALLRNPNPAMTGYAFREAVRGYKELSGNAFILKDDGREKYKGPPTALWLMRPDRVRIIPAKAGGVAKYIYQNEAGAEMAFDAARVIHLKFFNPYDTLYGQSTIQALAQTIELDVNAQIFNNAALKNGGRMAGYFQVTGMTDPKDRARFRAEVMNIHGGPRNVNKFGILWGDAKWQDMGIGLQDMQYIEARKMNRDEIISAFGLYPAVVGVAQADRARAEADERMFARNTMMPKIRQDDEGLTAGLGSDFGDGILIQSDFAGVPALQGDMVETANAASQVVTNRILSPNDARRKFYALGGYPGGEKILAPAMLVEVGTTPEPARSARAAEEPRELHYPTIYQERRVLAHQQTVKAIVGHATPIVKAMFDKQEEAVLARLERSRAIEDALSPEELAALGLLAIKRILAMAAEQGILHGKEPIDFIDVAFGFDDPRLQDWLATQAAKHVTMIDTTTEDALRQAISDAVGQGKTLSQIADDIRGVFGGRRDNAETIAQTEVQAGVQDTQLMVWRESGVVAEKEWLPSGHPKSRHTNMTWIVGLDEQFTNLNTGKKMMCPGDPNAGEPGETINCLCDMAPVVGAQAKADYLVGRLVKRLPAPGRGTREWQTRENVKALD